MYWPNYREDITRFQTACRTCRRIAPSNPSLPPTAQPDLPTYPFESVVADFFSLEGRNYLAMADRYSNWLSLQKLSKDDAPHLIQALRDYSTYFGIPCRLSSDGASIFTAAETEDFCKRWGIKQRISSSYYPRSNKRAEVAVKSCKRMVRDNLKPDGSLDGDKFARALLVHRNTPDPATGVSPAQIVFGKQLRDFLPTPLNKLQLRSDWVKAAKLREECFLKRHYAKVEDLSSKAKVLPALIPGDYVYVQDQNGKTPRQWNKSGKVLEVLPHDSYLIRIDGSYTTTRRNRKFLRRFTPFNQAIPQPPSYNHTNTFPIPDPADQTPFPTIPLPEPVDQEHVLHQPVQLNPSHDEQDRDVDQLVNVPHDVPHDVPIQQSQNKKPKHLRERWILTPDGLPQQDQQDQQIAAAARTFMQACLKVFHLNLSEASIGGGSITRT